MPNINDELYEAIYIKMTKIKDKKGSSYLYYNLHDIDLSDKNYIKDNISYAIDHLLTERERDVLQYKYIDKLNAKNICPKIGSKSIQVVNRIGRDALYKISTYIATITTENKEYYSDLITKKDFKSTRTFNCLRRGGYKTNSSLKGITHSDFIKIRDAGEKGWLDLVQYLDKHNIEYKNL